MDAFALEAKKDPGRRSDEGQVARLLESYRRDCVPQAIEQLFQMHNRLLKSIVHCHARSSGEPYEDLLQVGYVGLLKAVQGYQVESRARFGSYAYAMIDGELRHHHRDSRLMKQPRWARSLYSHISQATARLIDKLGRPPLIEEIAEEANVTLEGVREIMRLFHETDVSSLGEGVDLPAIRSQRYETFSLPIEDRIALEQALDSLSELQRRVVYLFFYKDLTAVLTSDKDRLRSPKRQKAMMVPSG